MTNRETFCDCCQTHWTFNEDGDWPLCPTCEGHYCEDCMPEHIRECEAEAAERKAKR